MEKQQVDTLDTVCSCEECGNYDPKYGNHCDALKIVFDDPGKCFAKMTREQRRAKEEIIKSQLVNPGQNRVLIKKEKYWKSHPLDLEETK